MHRPMSTQWVALGSLGSMVLKLLYFLIKLSLGSATLLPGLLFGFQAIETRLGRDESLWGAGLGFATLVLISTVIASSLIVISGWMRRTGRRGANLTIVLAVFFFCYNLYVDCTGTFAINDMIAQKSNDAASKVDERADAINGLTAERRQKAQDALYKTPAEVEALIQTQALENRQIWDRSRQCERGYVRSNDGLSEKLCTKIEQLRSQKAAALRVVQIDADLKAKWGYGTSTETKDEQETEILRKDSATRGTIVLLEFVFGKSDASKIDDPVQAAKVKQELARYIDGFMRSFFAELCGLIGMWLVFRMFEIGEWTMAQNGALPELVGSATKPQVSHTGRSNPVVDQWISGRTECGSDYIEAAKKIQDDYELWCRQNGIEKTGHWRRDLKAGLEAAGFVHLPKAKPVSYSGVRLKLQDNKLKVVK